MIYSPVRVLQNRHQKKQLIDLEALELIIEEEDASQDDDHLKINSESDDSDYKPKEKNAIHISPSKAIT